MRPQKKWNGCINFQLHKRIHTESELVLGTTISAIFMVPDFDHTVVKVIREIR